MAFFERKIRPVLVRHCYECHSARAEKLEGGLRLDTRAGIRAGGETGPAVVPGDPGRSLLLEAIEYGKIKMPPKHVLPDEIIADFHRWVKMGAPDPRDGAGPAGGAGRSDEGGDRVPRLWSLRLLASPDPPAVKDVAWPRTAVDRFILARLEGAGLRPVGDADSLTLLRRVWFDLVGLPPTPEAMAAFEKDPSPEAFEDVVDTLLASPRFGERWGRHWLDVVRYAESAGSSRDVLMPHAWRYRDYVIDAVNADVPFDRFVHEQVAGDLLPADSPAERRRLQVATGMLAIGQKSLNGGNVRMDLVDDQIDVVSRAFLGLTASCARCHDHKFDPIPTRDCYALAGIFLSTDTRYGGGVKRPETNADKAKVYLALGEEAREKVRRLRELDKQAEDLDKRRQAIEKKLKPLAKKLPKDWRKRRDDLRARAEAGRTATVPSDDEATAGDKTKSRRAEPLTKEQHKFLDLVTAFEAQKAELADTQAMLEAVKKQAASVSLDFAVGVRDSGKPADCRVHIGGERKNLGEEVDRGFLSCVTVPDAPEIDDQGSGRLDLARWLTHENNPLTPRVAVNRVWLHLLGRGLVPTVDNFGTTGQPTSHPLLLDHLAERLVREGWSMKSLIRHIVLSRSYQLASTFDASNHAADAENAWVWRQNRRRLEAEAIRDAMLAASGELDLDRPHASAVAAIGEGEVGRGIDTSPLRQPFPHRSVYLPIIRGMVPEILKRFDFPEPSNIQGQRDVTNIPPQALFLMNSPFVMERADAMARRLLAEESDAARRVERACRLALGRPPTSAQRAKVLEFLSRCDARLAKRQADAAEREGRCWSAFCQALFASAEFQFLD